MVVDLFIPCYIDQFFPDTAFNMIKVLERVGVTVNYNIEQTCCGRHTFVNGYWDEAKAIGEKFIKEFANSKNIVVPSASCAVMIKNNYPEMFHNSALHNEYKAVQRNTYEFTDFLVNVMNVQTIGGTFNGNVTLHRSCCAINEYGLKDEPIRLLRNVKGLNFVEMNEADMCCGYGGSLTQHNPAVANALARRKLDNASACKADFITSTEVTCLMHLQRNAQLQNVNMRVSHIADILAAGL